MKPDSVLTVHQEEELAKKQGRSLRIKYGIDPTAAHVHLGHSVSLFKLRQFQSEGHKPILIIGDYTAQIGDPTGRDETRPKMTKDVVMKNSEEYLKQIGKIVDLENAEVHYNSSWFEKMTFSQVINFISNTTISQMLERNDFSNRIKDGNPVFLHECLYPVMQAHDSVVVRSDVELGGSEQLFNLMLARDLQRQAGQEPQVCITVPILRGLDGKRRMGKSLDNYIGLDESADEVYAKTMSIPDNLMEEWWKLLPVDDTSWGTAAFDIFMNKDNMGIKNCLAARIVRFFHGNEKAKAAAETWRKRFTLRQDPDDIPEVCMPKQDEMWICKLLTTLKMCESNNQARRLIAPRWPQIGGSGVSIGAEKKVISDPSINIPLEDGMIVRVGSRKIVKLRLVAV